MRRQLSTTAAEKEDPMLNLPYLVLLTASADPETDAAPFIDYGG